MTAAQNDDPFTQRALQIYEEAKSQIRYVAHRFRQKIIRDGGLAAAKHWLRPSRTTTGFQRLLDHDRLDLSVEAVALEAPWNQLFTADELAVARARLEQFGYFNRPRRSETRSQEVHPDELPDPGEYPEGARATVWVSAYERNPEARNKCIDHYGATCYVCGFNFEEVYGAIGKGFIHVHHLTPFAGAAERRTSPVEDLRPVCPNCHAMLHRESPPLPVARLKYIMAAANRARRASRAVER